MKEPLTAEEIQAAQEREARDKRRAEQFRTMLREKNIMPLCKWSVALLQIAGDPRFVGVPTMDERRAIFEHFVEHRREDLKAEKKGGLKRARQLFTQFLREQFELDSWALNTTLSVFLSTLEDKIEPARYKDVQDNALALLTLSTQEKIYAKAVAAFKSDALKRDGEQLRLTRFIEDRLSVEGKSPLLQWEENRVQTLIREFYSSADTGGALLSEQKQRQVFDEVAARIAHSQARERDVAKKQSEGSRANHRLQSRDHTRGDVREASPRQQRSALDRDRHRSRSRSRRRCSRSDSRSQSRERMSRYRRRSHSNSRSHSRERTSGHRRRCSPTRSRSRVRSRRKTSNRRRHYSSSPSRSRSRMR